MYHGPMARQRSPNIMRTLQVLIPQKTIALGKMRAAQLDISLSKYVQALIEREAEPLKRALETQLEEHENSA